MTFADVLRDAVKRAATAPKCLDEYLYETAMEAADRLDVLERRVAVAERALIELHQQREAERVGG